KGEITLYTKSLSSTLKKKILIISTDINYNGGALMAFHSAKALKERGYEVWLATPKINQKLLYEIGKELINVAVCPALPYVSEIEMHWIKAFDKVVVNVYPMVATAAIISKVRPIIWWIHEPSEKYDNFYSTLRCWYHKYASLKDFSSAYIVAVSNIAKRNFEKYYPGRINSILTFGIPDEADNLPIAVNNGKLVFAIIGSVKELKGQQIFVEAALRILDEHYSAEFVIIGNYSKDEYSKELQDSILNISEIKLTGNLTRTELKATFNGIDVVVCASLEETMSLTIAEGMMHGKICITTDATGIADYISNGKNGFVCQVGSVESLYKTMKWVLDHRDELAVIKENARKTYEKHFTLDVLADRFEKAFEAIEEN
ncbi:MAG: glycosyltransferase family 4 protein, partial [Selenomonadaceae bacterium]|nr:glycosyltransferase family 4 protein [Selenomonadaceae bacterium]